MPPEWREHRLYEVLSVWGAVLLVLGIWPVLFLVIFLGYLNFPLVTLLVIAAAFFTWQFVRNLPHKLRSSVSGEHDRH